MPLEAARDLSIPDLLRVLNEKLCLECTRLQEAPLPPASVESEVRIPLSLSATAVAGSDG